jgi:hypothetical protein
MVLSERVTKSGARIQTWRYGSNGRPSWRWAAMWSGDYFPFDSIWLDHGNLDSAGGQQTWQSRVAGMETEVYIAYIHTPRFCFARSRSLFLNLRFPFSFPFSVEIKKNSNDTHATEIITRNEKDANEKMKTTELRDIFLVDSQPTCLATRKQMLHFFDKENILISRRY